MGKAAANGRKRALRFGCLSLTLVFVHALSATGARAQARPLGAPAVDSEGDFDKDELPVQSGPSGPVLANPSPWTVGIDGYAGPLVQWTGGDTRSHAIGGGLLRVRFNYFQLGAFIDTTDSGEASGLREETLEHFRTVGGFAGAWLPFVSWVDIDAALGLGSRRYRNPKELYGPNGLKETTTVLTFRLCVSSRTLGRFGVRVGGGLVGGIDLGPKDAMFQRRFLLADGSEGVTTGTIPVGGTAIGLILAVGFEAFPSAPPQD